MADYAKLTRAIKALQEGSYADAAVAKAKGALGAVFEHLSHLPDYFTTGKPDKPEGDLAKLSAKYGVEASPSTGKSVAGQPGIQVRMPGSGEDGYAYMDTRHNLDSLMAESIRNGHLDTTRLYAQMIARKKLSPQTQMFGIDTLNQAEGTGGAKSIYPMLYEWMLAQPDAANFAESGLSRGSLQRKVLNNVGALEKWGQPAADRILIMDEQLKPADNKAYAAKFHAQPVGQQIGELNAVAVPNTIVRTNKMLGALSNAFANNPTPELADMMRRARKLDLDGGWKPSTDVEPSYFDDLSNLMRDIAGAQSKEPQLVGKDSLRRAAIVNDALTQGLIGQDLEAQPYLYKGLARASGGRIPAHTPGALTQTCSCAGG